MNKIFVDLEYLCPSVSDEVNLIVTKVLKTKFNYTFDQDTEDEEDYLEYLDKQDMVKELMFNSKETYYTNILNFKELYNIDHIDPIRASYLFNNYSDICFVFYYNTLKELNAKNDLIKKVFGDISILPIPYRMNDQRVNKAEFIKEICKLDDLSDCLLLDNSYKSLEEWYLQGGEIDENSSEEIKFLKDNIELYVKKK